MIRFSVAATLAFWADVFQAGSNLTWDLAQRIKS